MTAEVLSLGALAMASKLPANIYVPSSARALCSQLQADLATIETPSDEGYEELKEQMRPSIPQLEKLDGASTALQQKIGASEKRTATARASFENRLQQLQLEMSTQQQEQQALVEENDELRRKVDGLRQGHGIDAAMEVRPPSALRPLPPPPPSPLTSRSPAPVSLLPHPSPPHRPAPHPPPPQALRESDARELSSLSKQLTALQQRLSSAKKEQFRVGTLRAILAQFRRNSAQFSDGRSIAATGENGSKNGKSLDALPATAAELRALGVEYKERGMLDASLAVLSAALSAAEAAGPVNGRSQLVDPLSALADLHLKAKREDEAINCLKRAYTLDKAALGPDAAEVGEHLIGLGRAYHAQGKLEAAALTYEEARSVLSYALGPQHPSVLTVKEKIKGLSVIEVDYEGLQPTSYRHSLPLTAPLTPRSSLYRSTPPRSRRRAARRAAARSRRGRRRARSSSTGWKSGSRRRRGRSSR